MSKKKFYVEAVNPKTTTAVHINVVIVNDSGVEGKPAFVEEVQQFPDSTIQDDHKAALAANTAAAQAICDRRNANQE